MPDITLPEIHLPDVKLPEGLRDLNREDIQKSIGDRLPKKIELPDVDLSKVELPKAVEDRLPRRKRSNPILPLAAVVAIGSLIAAAWWLITSPTAMLRVRETTDRIRSRLGVGGVDELDAEDRLETLLPDAGEPRPTVDDSWPATATDIGEEIRAGNGLGVDRPAGA
jgi:hypothetical protein